MVEVCPFSKESELKALISVSLAELLRFLYFWPKINTEHVQLDTLQFKGPRHHKRIEPRRNCRTASHRRREKRRRRARPCRTVRGGRGEGEVSARGGRFP